MMHWPGLILAITGPSGSGKTTYTQMLINYLGRDSCAHNVTVTIRHPRPGEVNGDRFLFVTMQEFKRMNDHGEFFCSADIFGSLYAFRTCDLLPHLKAGRDLVLDSIMAPNDLRRLGDNVVIVYLRTESNAELWQRIMNRNPNMNPDEAKYRKADFLAQHEVAKQCDYVIDSGGSRSSAKVFEDILLLYTACKASHARGAGIYPDSLSRFRVHKDELEATLPDDVEVSEGIWARRESEGLR